MYSIEALKLQFFLNIVKGLIKAAYDADITILDDNYDVVSTMILGKVVYNR